MHVRNADSDELAKVTIELGDRQWHGFVTETLWALRQDDGLYCLDNVPFHAYGYSYGDCVSAEASDGELIVRQVVTPGGHSTYRVFVESSAAEDGLRQLFQELVDIGCDRERATEHLYAIDVPPGANINDVWRLLDEGESAGVWEFEEGNCEHPVEG